MKEGAETAAMTAAGYETDAEAASNTAGSQASRAYINAWGYVSSHAADFQTYSLWVENL